MRLVNLDKRRPSCSLSLYIYVWVIFFLFNLLPFIKRDGMCCLL